MEKLWSRFPFVWNSLTDAICECGGWREEHDENGRAPDRECSDFKFSPTWNTPSAIADRGGEHGMNCLCALCQWERAPRHVYRIKQLDSEYHCVGRTLEEALDVLYARVGDLQPTSISIVVHEVFANVYSFENQLPSN